MFIPHSFDSAHALYPIALKGECSDSAGNKALRLSGRLVLQVLPERRIDISQLSPGSYHLNVLTEQGEFHRQFQVVR